MIKVLFICTSNTSRSVMASAIGNNLKEMEYEDLDVIFDSAGLVANDGDNPNFMAQKAMKEVGIDISKYRSKSVSDGLISESDYVLTMTMAHKKLLETLYPHVINKVYSLGEFIDDKSLDIFDTFNMDYDTYVSTRDDLTTSMVELLEKLQKQ